MRTSLALMAVCALLALAMPVWIRAGTAPSSALPELADGALASGESFTTTDLEWMDQSRGRRVPATLFWPASARTGKVPLVVFSHGIGSSRDGYGYLGRYWARHGIASLHLQHVGSDRSLWQGNVLLLVSRFQHATSDEEAIARVQDFRFALDQLLAGTQGAHIARDRIIAAGHSYGANTTLMVAGAKVMRKGKLLQFRDPRISSAMVISAPPFYGEQDFVPILSGITIPTLQVSTLDDVIRIPGFGSGVDDRLKVFNATGGDKVLAMYRHGSHNVFTERRYFDSRQVADEVKGNTEALSLAFIAHVYGGQDSLRDWGKLHQDLIAEYVVRH